MHKIDSARFLCLYTLNWEGYFEEIIQVNTPNCKYAWLLRNLATKFIIKLFELAKLMIKKSNIPFYF